MNYSIIRKILGVVIQFTGAFLALPAVCGLFYGEKQAIVYAVLSIAYFVIGRIISGFKLKSNAYYAREGLVIVGMSWIVISILGAIPLVITKDIPSFTDALFETVSGFTTTGSSILSDVEALSHTGLFWRSFTHWVGGMGVIVFILAVLPMTGGYNMNLMRAESPGPTVGKLVPRMKDTAKILYTIYFGITVTEIIVLVIVGMPLFDALCISFGSAGTGGFGVRNDSCGGYSNLMQSIITVFILMFGVNFNAYFFILRRKFDEVFKMSELKGYFGIVAFSIITITINVRNMFPSLYQAFHHSAFQVASIITTTGFATADFDQWPQYSRALLVLIMFVGACAGSTGGGMKVSRIMLMLLVLIMFVGACAGSTGGGMKVSRIMLMFKTVYREIRKYLHPRAVTNVTMDGKTMDRSTLHSVSVYLSTYMLLFSVSVIAITLFENLDLETVFTSVACTFNNIGPGLSKVGPTCNFGFMQPVTKYILMFDMLAGRLELYPMLMLLTPAVWKNA